MIIMTSLSLLNLFHFTPPGTRIPIFLSGVRRTEEKLISAMECVLLSEEFFCMTQVFHTSGWSFSWFERGKNEISEDQIDSILMLKPVEGGNGMDGWVSSVYKAV
jgi:hypothetical protein